MFKATITQQEIEKMKMVGFKGEIVVVDSLDEKFDEGIAYLNSLPAIGFDTESRPSFTASRPAYGTSLLQLSGPDRAYLFRVKYIGMPAALRGILSDPGILKIGAAIQDDNHGLQKYGDFTPAGFVDLQQIVGQWGIYDKSVKKMAAIILGVKISKSQQLSNWEAEFLTQAQQRYAATDAWICLEMYSRLNASAKNPLTPEQISELSGIPVETILHPKKKEKKAPPQRKWPAGLSASAKRRLRRKQQKQRQQQQASANDKSDITKG